MISCNFYFPPTLFIDLYFHSDGRLTTIEPGYHNPVTFFYAKNTFEDINPPEKPGDVSLTRKRPQDDVAKTEYDGFLESSDDSDDDSVLSLTDTKDDDEEEEHEPVRKRLRRNVERQ
jgi:hypothetical protein